MSTIKTSISCFYKPLRNAETNTARRAGDDRRTLWCRLYARHNFQAAQGSDDSMRREAERLEAVDLPQR